MKNIFLFIKRKNYGYIGSACMATAALGYSGPTPARQRNGNWPHVFMITVTFT